MVDFIFIKIVNLTNKTGAPISLKVAGFGESYKDAQGVDRINTYEDAWGKPHNNCLADGFFTNPETVITLQPGEEKKMYDNPIKIVIPVSINREEEDYFLDLLSHEINFDPTFSKDYFVEGSNIGKNKIYDYGFCDYDEIIKLYASKK